MNLIAIAVVIAVVSTLNIGCFLVGAKVGQTVSNGKPIELPTINPMKAIREMQDKREAEREQSKVETIMHNIDNYDGTSAGQKDIQ